MKIDQMKNNKIRVTGDDRGFIESQTVEANLLYAILTKLEDILAHIKLRSAG